MILVLKHKGLETEEVRQKRVYWKYQQRKRDSFENRFTASIRAALNKQFRKLSDQVTPDNYRSESLFIDGKFMEEAIRELYKVVGASFAREQYQNLKAKKNENALILVKQEDDWMNYLSSYAKVDAGKRITSINKSSRDQALKIIRKILEITVAEGLGADETAWMVKKGLVDQGVEMNYWRALRIARTEIVTASNIGSLLGAKETGYPMQKYWISTYDDRTRDTHLTVERQNPKMIDEGFRVGSYFMECPGDPDAGPEEVINCRCTIAFQVMEIENQIRTGKL